MNTKWRIIAFGLLALALSGTPAVATSSSLARAAAPQAPKFIHAEVHGTAVRSGSSITIRSLLVTHVPGGSAVSFRCASGCSYSATRKGPGRVVAGVTVHDRTVAIVRVTKPQYVGFYDRLVFHSYGDNFFSEKPMCMAPGNSKPVSCKHFRQGKAQAPSKPANLTVGAVTTTSISLTWTASKGGGSIGYDLYVGNTPVASTAGTSYTFTGLACGTTYTLGVRASNGGGTSGMATKSASTSACAPSQPTNLTVGTVTRTSIALSWTASTGDVSHYAVYLGSTFVAYTTGTSYNFTGLTCGTAYTLGVQASSGGGQASAVATKPASTSACGPYQVQSCWSQYTANSWSNVDPTAAKTAFVGSSILGVGPENYWSVVRLQFSSAVGVTGARVTLIAPNGATFDYATFDIPSFAGTFTEAVGFEFWTYTADGSEFFQHPEVSGSGTWTIRWTFPDGETCNNAFTVS